MPPRRSARAAAAPPPAKAASPSPSPSPPAPAAPAAAPAAKIRVYVAGAFPGQSAADVGDKAKKLGLAVGFNLTKTVTHMVTSQSEFDSDSAKIMKAKAQGVKLVSADWLDECEKDGKVVDETPFLFGQSAAPASPAKPAAKGTKSKKRGASPTSDDDTKPAKPAAKKSKKDTASTAVGNSALQAKADKATAATATTNGQIAKKTKGFNVPVDEVCSLAALGYQVYIDAENVIYDGNLNQTNASNNNNKFYRVQVGGVEMALTRSSCTTRRLTTTRRGPDGAVSARSASLPSSATGAYPAP